MDKNTYTHVFYHGNCPDGFGAAWAAWKFLADRATYIPCFFEQPVPEVPRHARVLIVDFSFPRDKALDLANRVETICQLDHHQTAADMMKGVPWATFDMTHSGAYLSWMHFFGKPVPEFVQYLEDRDLWRFQMPYSREVAAAVGSYPMKFEVWEVLSTMGMEKLKFDGGIILRSQGPLIDEMISRVRWQEFDGHKVPVVNATTLFSQVGDKLCQMYPDAPFAAYYYDRKDGKRQWGLRSPGRIDVSEIAKRRGGGGHPGASGFVEELKG